MPYLSTAALAQKVSRISPAAEGRRWLSLALAVAAASCGVARPPGRLGPTDRAAIDTSLIRTHTRFLADDMLAGRRTGTTGAQIAARYLRAACELMGLHPVGGRYLHPLPVVDVVLRRDEGSLLLRRPSGEARFTHPTSFVPWGGDTMALQAFGGAAVYVGTDTEVIEAERVRAGGAEAVAVTLGIVGSQAGRRLAEGGFRGIIQLIPDSAGYTRFTADGSEQVLVDGELRSSFFPPLPAVVAGPRVAAALIRGLAPGTADAPPWELDVGVQVRVDADTRPVSAHNVGCVLPGRDATPADTAIVFTAHYDHLGVTAPDATGDSIYNGFSDNAAGVAMLLAIADAAVRNGGLRHSVLFLFLAGEEQGLLGSDYYVTRPAWPLDRVAGVINLDAGAPPARPSNWRIAGGDGSPLGTLAVHVAMGMGAAATTSPPRPNSDYYPFWRLGVPAIFIVPGNAPYEGLSSDSSQALRERWDRYHQRRDEWAPDFPFEGLARYAEYARRVGWALDHLGR